MQDLNGTLVQPGDWLVDCRGKVFRVVETEETIYKYGFRVTATEQRPTRGDWLLPIDSGVKTHLPLKSIVRIESLETLAYGLKALGNGLLLYEMRSRPSVERAVESGKKERAARFARLTERGIYNSGGHAVS